MNSSLRHFLRKEWPQLVLIALPLAGALAALPRVTNPVPIHWNLQGRADGFISEPWGIMLTPAILALVIVVVLLFEHYDKHRLSEGGILSTHGRAVRTIRLAISVLFAALCLLQIFWALGHPPDTTRLLPSGIALLFAFMGNLFGKLKRNRYIGIRVSWTMNSEEVWRRTHRITGWLWTGGGLLFAAAVWLLPAPLLSAAALAWILVLTIIPLGIAWHAAKHERPPVTDP